MTHVDIEFYRLKCPHCGHQYSIELHENELHLGQGSRACAKCGRAFPDGSIEWPLMTPEQKRKFLLIPAAWMSSIAFAFVAAMLEEAWRSKDDNYYLVMGWGLVIALGLLFVLYLILWVSIIRSKRRIFRSAVKG